VAANHLLTESCGHAPQSSHFQGLVGEVVAAVVDEVVVPVAVLPGGADVDFYFLVAYFV
jgi:hypothetical protein